MRTLIAPVCMQFSRRAGDLIAPVCWSRHFMPVEWCFGGLHFLVLQHQDAGRFGHKTTQSSKTFCKCLYAVIGWCVYPLRTRAHIRSVSCVCVCVCVWAFSCVWIMYVYRCAFIFVPTPSSCLPKGDPSYMKSRRNFDSQSS